MAFWNPNQIISINDGIRPNDGTGDDIRDAFIKVNESFANVSQQLAQPIQDWLNANVQQQLNTNYVTTSNLFVSNATGITATFTGNITGGNVTANTGFYSSGTSILGGNTYAGNIAISGTSQFNGNVSVSAAIIPTANLTYDLGSPSNFFRNLYTQGLVQVNTVSLQSSASILELQPNVVVGVPKDVGILGQYNQAGANNFAYFGFQAATDNFIYYQTSFNATTGNSINYGGVYGNTQFGSQFLSNTTISTSTSTGALIVAGGVGVAGNVYAATHYGNIVSTTATIGNASVTGSVLGNLSVAGNIFAYGGQVLTTGSTGFGTLYTAGAAITGNIVYTSITPSTSTTTGAVIYYGGVGVGGNVNAFGFTGQIYGAQNNISSLSVGGGNTTISSSGSINTNGISATSVGAGTVTVTSQLNMSGAAITNLTSLATSGNITAPWFIGNISGSIETATGNVTAAYFNGNGIALSGVATTPQLTATNANITAANAAIVTVNNAWQANTAVLYTSIQTNNANEVTLGNSIAILNANVGAFETYANATFSTQSTVQTLNANVGAFETYANATFSTQSTVQTLNANVGAFELSTNANLGSVYNHVNTLDANVGAFETYANIHFGTSSYTNANVAAYLPSYNGNIASSTLTISGNILPSANVGSATINIGSNSLWFNNIYGVASHAQYADLAENYLSDVDYQPGTVVVFGGDEEITVTTIFADPRVAGAISTNPAYLMNGASGGLPLALRGRIPCQVIGPVTKGDSLVTSQTAGYAVSVGTSLAFGQAVFAKALETDLTDGIKIIEVVIL